MNRSQFSGEMSIGGDDRFHLVAVVDGKVRVSGDPSDIPLVKGQTVLLPAAIGEVGLQTDSSATLLDIHLP